MVGLTVFKKEGHAGKTVTNVGVTTEMRTVHIVNTVSRQINISPLYAVLVGLHVTNERVACMTKYYRQQDGQGTIT